MNASRLLLAAALAGLLLALTGTALSAPAAGTTTVAGGPRILFGSCGGAFTILPDGSGLAPVVPRERRLMPLALSHDGRTVAYTDQGDNAIYISRANGTALRRLGRYWGNPLALSRDGRLLALSGKKGGIWIVRTNGRGLRRLTSVRDDGVADTRRRSSSSVPQAEARTSSSSRSAGSHSCSPVAGNRLVGHPMGAGLPTATTGCGSSDPTAGSGTASSRGSPIFRGHPTASGWRSPEAAASATASVSSASTGGVSSGCG